MANFDMDSYLAQRFAGVGANKLAELDKARADKIAGLQQFRQNIAANSANILAEKEAQANSWVGQSGLAPDSFSGEAVNLAAEGWSGLSRLVGTGVSAVPGLEARRIEGQLSSEEYQATATPDQVKALEARAVKARQAEVNITEAFNRSDIIDQTDRNKLQQELKAGFADPWKQYTEGGQRVYDGDLAGTGDIVSGMARLLYTGVKGAVDNPRAALGYAVENAPQLAVGALPKVGGALLAGSNMSYGNELYSRGIENYRQANNGAMPPDDELRSMALHAASAVAAEQAGDMFSLGSAKGVAKEVSRAGFKESLKNIGSVTGKNYLSEGATEGYQTYAEGQATGEKVTAADIFTGAAIGAMSGAQMAGSARALSELTQTTPEAQERKLKSAAEAFQEKADFDAMAKANDPSTLLDPTARTYDPLKAVGVLFEHAKAADTTPEVKQENLLKARELVQNLEATQERNVRVLDIASTPSALSEAKEELIGLKEQLIATDPDNKPRTVVLDQQIALREEAIALSADKVALKRLSGEVKRSEQQLSSTKTLQENFADSIRKNATVDEVATHIAKATRPMSADNMPDIEESRQSVQALVNIAMVSPNSISVEDANNLVNNKNSALTPEQRDYFRQFSEARIAENNLMNLDKVHQAIFTGTAQDTGIVEYRRTIGQALEAGDEKAAEKSLLALQTFAQNHTEKQQIALGLFSKVVKVAPDGRKVPLGDRQVLRVKTGGWEVVPAGKPLKDAVVKANGGFKIHPNSGEFVGNMQTEVVALNQVVKEQQAAFTLRFGKPSASFVATPASASVAPAVPAVESTASQTPTETLSVAKQAEGTARPDLNKTVETRLTKEDYEGLDTVAQVDAFLKDSHALWKKGNAAPEVASRLNAMFGSGNYASTDLAGFYDGLKGGNAELGHEELLAKLVAEATTQPQITATQAQYDEAVRVSQSANEADYDSVPEEIGALITALNNGEDITITEAVPQTVSEAMADLQARLKDRVFRALTSTEQAMLDTVLTRLEAVFGKELKELKHFFVQDGTSKIGTFFGGLDIIGLNPDVFNKPAEGLDATAEERLFRTLAHELAHARDFSNAEYNETLEDFVYPTENIASLKPQGKTYMAVQEAMKKSPVLNVWFANIMASTLAVNRVPRELYAQLYALYLTKPELMNEKTGLAQAYQAIKRDIENHEKAANPERVSNGSGVPENAGEPTSASNESSKNEGETLRVAGGVQVTEGTAFAVGLDALQGTKSSPGTAYQDRNLLVDHFSQAVAGLTAASQRPLVVAKNFISSLSNGTGTLLEFLKDYKSTDKQEAALALFTRIAAPTSKWSKTIQGLLIHGYFTQNGKYNEDRKNFFKNPFNWMISKDTAGVYSIEENTNTALVYAALTTLLELADAPPYNDNKTINAILGREEDALVPYIARDVLGNVGTLATLVRNSAGQTAASALGLKADDNAGQDLKPKLEGGMGAMVEALLLSLKLIEIDPVSPADINAVLKATNEIDGKREGKGLANEGELRSFLKIARNAETGEYTPAVKELLEGLRGSNNVLDKLMSVEAALKYPSLTPIVSTQTTTKTGQQVPSLLTDTNNQNSSQANYTREDMWKLLNAVTPEVAGAMAGIEEISDTKTQNTKKQSIKAKNDGLWRELNRYHDYVNDVLLATTDKLKQPFYLDYSVWLQQRVGIATNVINPQTSKAHRALFYRKDWESKVMLDNDDMLDNFMLRVGEGFGIKTDRDTVDASFEQITKVIDDPVVVTAVEALQKLFTTDSVLTKEDQANLLAAVKLGKENFHTLDALVALAHYQTALDTDAKFFVTHLQAEVDGVANGPILAHALFGAASSAVMGEETQDQADARALNATMERGGIYTEGSGEQAFNDWIADPVNQDLYENTIAKVIQSIANSVNSASPGLANAVYFFTGTLTKEDGDVSSDGRKIIKGPVTEMVFGSGVAKSIDHMAELFIAKVYDVLEKSTNGDEKYPVEAVVNNLNLLLGSSLSVQDAKKFNTEFFLDSVEAASIKTKFKAVFAEPVTEAIETNFADFLERRTAFTKAAEFTHGLYSTVYAAMRQEMLDKLVADELANPGTGIASTYKTVPVNRFDLSKGTKKETTYLRDLSKAEERQLEKQLAAMFPVVQTLFSLESQQPKAGLRIGKFRQEVSLDSAYTTTAHFRIGQQDSTSTTVRGMKKVHEGPGVAMLPLLIHSLDSYISHSAQMGMQMLNIHDAVITGLDTIYKASERMNEQTFHALLSFSPMSEMYQALENTVKGLGNLSLSNETSAALADYLAKFAVDNQMESSNVLADMLQDTKAAAAKADTVKFTAMKQWAFVNQYARENSSYAVTEADQAKVTEALGKVTSEVPGVALLAANTTYKSVSKAMSTAYAKKVRTAAWLADKKAKEAKKKVSVDNMPDISAVPVIRTYSTQDIYNALSYNPVSAAFDTHLRDVLTNIVEKLHGAFGSFKEAMAQSTTESASALFAEAVTTGKAPLTFSLFGSGIKFNDQQAFVAEQVHATILAALDNTNGNKSAVYNELSKLFRETRTRLKDSAWAKDPATAGLYARIFNQIPADTEGRSNYLAEFAALGLAHEEFNALLKVPTKMEAAVFEDTTILGVLKRLFAKILETFNGRVTGTVPGQQADKKLNALITKLVMIENKRKAVLEAERKGLLKFIDKQMGDLREVKKSAISKIANSPKFMKNKNVFIASASGVVATVADSQVGLFFRNVDKVRNANFEGRPGMFMGFLSEMNGPKPMIQKLLRTIKHFEGQRKKIISMTGKFVLQGFDNQGKHLEDFDKRALTKVLLHTGAHSLLDHFDTDKLLTLLKDPKALAAEIVVFEQQLTGYTPAQEKYFVEQSRSLGYWMVTGKFTHEMPMKNADNIARGFMSGTKHTLTEAQIATAKVTLDALSSLYALSYTDASQTDSVAKSLEQELARPDGGNGVRLLLLSHKEMEQQAKERLFSGNEALMIKGYMPEIYNPHTDVKAANQKDGEMLEALGYVAGAAVSNDPADFDPEAKRLYTLRDGAIMPWLSGIFSFTGMRSKGTKHHGKFANRTQQAITQDKMAAIQARSPSESGYNFDPRQVKDSHMAPLMNSLGQAVNYQYMMHNDTKDNLLERDTRFDSVMGALNGSIYDKENSAVHNKKSVEVFFKEFDEGYTKEPRAFLEVSATSTDPELRDIYKMLPQTTKDAIREIWGKDAMMVRVSHLDIAFGYRKQSLSTSFDKEKEDRNLIEKAMVPLTLTVLHTVGKFKGMSDAEAERFTKRAGVYVRRGEDVWKAVVQETKDIIVVKSGVAMMSNIASNLLLLKLYGVGTVTGLKDMQIAWVGARDYDRDSKKLFELETLIASKATTTGLADLNLQVRELKDALARNPVRKLIDEGLMPTIVEDVSEDEDIYGFKSRIVRSTEKYISKLNKTVVAAGKQMYMTHDTQMYKGMAQLTQLSDFVARYALYQHLTTRTDNPISEKVAIQEASDAFINYDVPMQRDIQYLDDMGILPFTKYFLRIQRVIRGRFRHAPGKVALMLLAQGYMDWLPSPLDSSIFFKIGNNPMNWGALQFPGVLDELATYKAATSLFK